MDRHLPTLACLFALVVSPLLIFYSYTDPHALEVRPENRIFWPAMALIALVLTLKNLPRLANDPWPPHILALLGYLGFAGLSAAWAFSPESSFVRFIQQFMVVVTIILPARLARKADLMHGLFLCFALSLVLSSYYVLNGSVTLAQYGARLADIGYQGYFQGKNYLGECAAVALLLSIYEASFPGWRRALGILFTCLSVTLILLSNSKTAFGLALVCPLIAQVALVARRTTRASLAVVISDNSCGLLRVILYIQHQYEPLGVYPLSRLDVNRAHHHMGFCTKRDRAQTARWMGLSVLLVRAELACDLRCPGVGQNDAQRSQRVLRHAARAGVRRSCSAFGVHLYNAARRGTRRRPRPGPGKACAVPHPIRYLLQLFRKPVDAWFRVPLGRLSHSCCGGRPTMERSASEEAG